MLRKLVLKKWNVFGMKIFEKKPFEKCFYSPLKKQPVHIETTAIKVVINSKEKSEAIAAERSLFGYIWFLQSLESLSLEFVIGFSFSLIPGL